MNIPGLGQAADSDFKEDRPAATSATPPEVAASGRWSRVRRGLLLAALALGLVLVAMSDTAHAGLTWALDAAAPLLTGDPFVGVAVFVGLAALSAMLAFFSSAVLVPLALDVWGLPATVALLWVGWTLGGVGAYAVGRFLGRPAAAVLSTGDLLARYERQVTGRVSFGAVVLFQLALPSEIPGYALGLARYSPWRFVLALALAEVPFALLTVYVGAGVLERRPVLLLAALAGVALLSSASYLIVRRRDRSA